MASENTPSESKSRNWVALGTLGFSALALTILAAIAMASSAANAKDIFNIVLPVIASWVGTILAFYFGRENFESASRQSRETNQQLQKIVERLSPEERANVQVTAIMRRLADFVCFKIPQAKTEQDVTLKDLRANFTETITRLPIVEADDRPKYMIHQSRVDKYLVEGGKEDDKLATFIAEQKKKGVEFGLDKGFIVVSEKATLSEAKQKTERAQGCQDIFITRNGTAEEPLLGWVSNVRMAKFLQP
ncbi:MAG: hypothetical protein HY782_25255 [Chloroflexi bacterium]|nr:hypothetical protein [Chloroflexota bacterium]